MLYKILIQNIVLIKKLEIEFKPGLSVLTGETGTGKSILIDSLGLILGNRSNFKLIRKGEQKGNVTAIFKIDKSHTVNEYLSSINLDVSDELIIRREININGKSTSFINDIPVSINTLQNVSLYLVEIQGQFENHSLLNEKNHLNLLDKFCENKPLLKEVENLWDIYISKKDKFKMFMKDIEFHKNNEEWLKDSLKKIQLLSPDENEEESLLKRRKILISQDKIITALETGRQTLDEENGLNDKIRKFSNVFGKLEDLEDEDIKKINLLVQELYIHLEELTNIINNKNINQHSYKQDLETLEDRLYELRKQANKHNCKINDLINVQNDLQIKLDNINENELLIEKFKSEIENCYDKYLISSKKLSEIRKEKSMSLMEQINNELPSLKLENCNFKIKFNETSVEDYSKNGIDKVSFLARTNEGSNFGKIIDIASGGELSRLLLAIKVIVEHDLDKKTLIFDEVDTGIGGATASAVGQKLAKIGGKYQTLAVTHSPQVSAKGINHYLITKEFNNNNTESKTIELTDNERIEEIARMISDNKISEEARNAAKKLLENQ